MHKRTLAILAVAAAAGAALPFGLPQTAHASTIASITIAPLPIAQPGTLTTPTAVQLCVQPKDASGHPVGVGVTVYLSFYSGLFTPPPGTHTSTATVGATSLTQTPAQFTTVASCTDAGGTVTDAISVTYTSPTTPVPTHGRDVLIAADSVPDSGTTGSCPAPAGTLCSNGTYVYSPVTQYVFNPAAPIATTGTLTAGQQLIFDVIAEDATNNPVPGAFLNLSLTSSAGALGSATGVNSFSGFPKEKITNTPNRFGADANGSVAVTYTAANPLPSPASGTDTITAQDHKNSPTFTAPTTYSYGAGPPFSQAPYTPITPFRVCDTRPTGGGIVSNQCDNNSTGGGTGPVTQGAKRVVTIVGFGSPAVPSGATAVVVNLTAVAPTRSTYITLIPDGGTSGTSVSNLNPQAAEVVANLVEVPLSAGGKIDVYNNLGSVNVILDIEGYVSSASTGLFNAITPARICDTRAAGGGIASNQCDLSGPAPIAAGQSLTFNVHTATDNVPASGVTAVVFNLTAIAPSKTTVLTAYAGGGTRPGASNVNVTAGAIVPNRVIVPVSASGTVSIWNSVGSANIAVDVNGWFGASGLQYTTVTPARVCDTRTSSSNAEGCTQGMVLAGSGHILNINITGIAGIPPLTGPHAPVAVVLNVTSANATAPTFVTVYPGPSSTSNPGVSDLNVASGNAVPNLVVVAVGSDGTINLFNNVGATNLIVDVFGFYS